MKSWTNSGTNSGTNSACPRGFGRWSVQPSRHEEVLGFQETAKTQKRPSQKFGVSLRQEPFNKHLIFSPFPRWTFFTLVRFCLGLWSFSLRFRLMRSASYCTRVENGSTLSRLRWTARQRRWPHLLRAACYPGLISSPAPHVAPRVMEFCHRSRLSSAQPFVFDLSPKKHKTVPFAPFDQAERPACVTAEAHSFRQRRDDTVEPRLAINSCAFFLVL